MTRKKSLVLIGAMGAWTAITLAGSIFLIFNTPLFEMVIDGTISHLFNYAEIVVMLVLFLAVGGLGGALWGGGLAGLLGQPVKSPARWGALYWGSSVLVTGMVLGLSQGPVFAIDRAVSLSTYDLHFLFTLDFTVVVGITTLIIAYLMVGKLGRPDKRGRIALQTGAAAAAGFLVVSLAVLYGWGWEIAGPFAGRRYSMILIMNVCNLGAALAGGLVLGRALVGALEVDGIDRLSLMRQG